MNSLTPASPRGTHAPDHLPTPAPAPQPPVGPGQTPHPDPSSAPRGRIPYTDGTPAPGRQKNARSFLAGSTPGVMAGYMPENNRVDARGADPRKALPTQQDDETVRRLMEWRREAPYG